MREAYGSLHRLMGENMIYAKHKPRFSPFIMADRRENVKQLVSEVI
jgi:hypothetical protein